MRKGLLLLGVLAWLALAAPAAEGLFAGFWRLLFAPVFVLAF
jgi:hypothetical protein